MLFQSGNTNFNTTFSQLQTALSTNIGTSSNSINAVYVTHNPLTNSILGNASTATIASNFVGLLSNTNLPNPLDLSHGSNLPPTAITSGGAVSGQTLSWNGLYWVPVTPTAGTNNAATNVVWPVIGDTHLVGVTNGLAVTLTAPWSGTANEYWIGTNAVTGADGTQLRPFDGSTQVKFDALMKAIYTNHTVVHLNAGEYRTQGKQSSTNIWSTPSDSRLLGAGMGITTIKLEDSPVVGNTVIVTPAVTNPSPPPFVTPLVTNVEICDLTIDCNGANLGTTHRSISGIILNGAYRSAIRRVHVIHQIGDALAPSGGEAFGILTEAGFAGGGGGGNDDDPTTRTIVDSCVVSDVISNYNSLICPSSGCDVINSYVYMPIITNGVTPGYPIGSAVGFNVTGNDSRVLNCSSFGGTAGIYSDSWACTNIVIANNTLRECLFGIQLIHVSAGKPIVGVIIANNTINLSRYGQSVSGFLAGIYCPTLADRNYLITGNRIAWDKPTSGQPQYGWAIDIGGVTGATIVNNILDDGNLAAYMDVSGLNYYGNVNLNGLQPNFFNGAHNIYQTNVNQFITASNYIGGLAGGTNLPLAGLAQSGALVGYIPAWNGTTWVPVVPPSGGGSGTGIQTNSGSGINNTFTNVTIWSGQIYGGAVTSVVSSATTAVTASSVIAGITNTWRTDATNAAAFYSQSATNSAALNAMGFALLSDATNAANKASQNATNTTRLNSNGLALLTDVTNEANYATQNSTNTAKLNANGLALKTDATNAALGSIAPYAINATNVLVNILTNKLDGTNLISGGATAGQVPVADGTGKTAWGGVNASQSPLTNNVNAAGFSGTNYATLQATNFDINGTGEPILSLYDAGGNLMAGFVSSNWFGNGAGLSNVIQSTFNVTKTANYSVTSADNGTRFNNFGAGAAVTNTLPASSVNLHFYFIVAAANNLTVKASNPDTIWYGGHQSSAGGFINSLTRGDVVHIFCPVTNQWFCDGVSPNPGWSAP